MKGFDLVTMSNFRGKIWKTIIHTQVTYINCLLKNISITVGNSSHGMAKNIKSLGLDTTKPFMLQTSDKFKSRLNHGMSIADWPTPPLPYPPAGGDGIAKGVTV
jgi:hypothetical protein